MNNKSTFNTLKPKHLFSTSFEERAALEYLLNLIHSRYLGHHPAELLKCATFSLGQQKVLLSFIRNRAKNQSRDEFLQKVSLDPFQLNLSITEIRQGLKTHISEMIKERLRHKALLKTSKVDNRFQYLQNLFKLRDEDLKLLKFIYFLDKCEPFRDALDISFRHLRESFSQVSIYALKMKLSTLNKIISNGSITPALLVDTDCSALHDWCIDYLDGAGDASLLSQFYTRSDSASLEMSCFQLDYMQLSILDDLLTSDSAHNILFFGAEGTGKSSLAMTLAKKYGREIYCVKIPEDDQIKDRMAAVIATKNIAAQTGALILVDEADELLNAYSSSANKSAASKCWINNLLESGKNKIVWITNRISEIAPSTMRRFSFALEFKPYNAKQRRRVLEYELAKSNMTYLYSDSELSDICRKYEINAGSIASTFQSLKVRTNEDQSLTKSKINTMLEIHTKITGYKLDKNPSWKNLDNYNLNILNTTHALDSTISSMQGYFASLNSVQHAKPMSLLLHGLPGTGKTEFVHYLGQTLSKEITLKKSSDISSMWVGETEKNIAKAFEDSRAEETILFFDEADSFLYPRSDAMRSWEISVTNEILAQLDQHSGVVIFATNNIDGLDRAALRRFRFKIQFKPLNSDGCLRIYKSMLQPFAGNYRLSQMHTRRIRQFTNLTPGDFAVVRDQFMFANSSSTTHEALINALTEEAGYKEDATRITGFGRNV